jgi:hypothetical protein
LYGSATAATAATATQHMHCRQWLVLMQRQKSQAQHLAMSLLAGTCITEGTETGFSTSWKA